MNTLKSVLRFGFAHILGRYSLGILCSGEHSLELMYSLEYLYGANVSEMALKGREFTSEMQGRHPPQEPFYLQLCLISKTSTKDTESFC